MTLYQQLVELLNMIAERGEVLKFAIGSRADQLPHDEVDLMIRNRPLLY